MAKRRAGPTLVQQSRRVPPEAKARMHQIEAKVRRPFLGLTPDEVAAISKRLDDGIRRNLSKSS